MVITKYLKKIKRVDILICLFLLVLAFFFRLWKLKSFQYWSDDEQILWAIVRHLVIDKHPSLVIPNSALGLSFGPLFHYLVAPWYWIIKFDPQKILLLGNLFTFFNVILIYAAGNLLGGRKVGFAAGFLYAVSFLSSLFDRRLWALSPNIPLVLLGTISLIQVVKGKSKYIFLLVIPIVFSVNSDPSLGIIALASIFTFLILKPKIQKKYIMYSVLLGILLLSPLIFFELRHSGQNIRSLSSLKLENYQKESDPLFPSQLKNFSRFFFAQGSNTAEAYFCYCKPDDKVSPVLILAVSAMIAAFIFRAIKNKDKGKGELILVLVSYLTGIYVFKTFLGGNPAFFYSVTIFPILFLMAGVVISDIKYLPLLLLPSLLLANFYSLYHSSFKYPLSKKMEVVEQTIKKIPDKNNFSLYYSGDILVSGGGWTALFMSKGYTPSKGSLSAYWGHVYESYNLYPIPFSLEEPQTVVVISQGDSKVYNNEGKWFNPAVYIENLYQPKYFE